MLEVNLKELRTKLRLVIQQVEAGEEIRITRRGKEVARLVPPSHPTKQFPDLTEFRASIKLEGASPLAALLAMREEDR
ncbi:MAG: type II toxin-antitoxin system prevent-host-death family antitoxin [Caldilineaceae bacterium]|mgnify:CR=1 FL=1|nr:type II toxin-antitoxin system prevent-host-death family antitoxin [Caldilineaceae bacterium]